MKVLFLLLALMFLPFASAHFPYIAGPESSARDPIVIEDIHLSQVWYFEQETSDSDVWLFFGTDTSDELFVQLGVPVLDQLENYKPTITIYHIHVMNKDGGLVDFDDSEDWHSQQQLPDTFSFHEHANYTANFAKPSEACTAGISNESPCIFHETFTDTYSWILAEDRLPLEPGRYLIRGTSEDKGTMWIAVGEREDFSVSSLPSLVSATSSINSAHGKESNNTSILIATVSVLAFVGFVIYRRRSS